MLPFRVAHSGRPFCGDGNALCVLSSRNYWLCVYCETQELEFSLPHVAMATYCVIPCSFKIACSKFLYSQRSTFGTKSLPHNWPGICSPPQAIVTIWKNSKGGPQISLLPTAPPVSHVHSRHCIVPVKHSVVHRLIAVISDSAAFALNLVPHKNQKVNFRGK